MIGSGVNISVPRDDGSRHMKYVASAKSVEFDGATDALEIADHNDFSPTDGSNNDKAFSFACWIKNDVSGTGVTSRATLISKGTTTNTKEYKVILHNGIIYFDILDASDSVYKRVNTAAGVINSPHNTWYHVVCTYDGSELGAGLNIYVDGVNANSGTGQSGTWQGIHNTASVIRFGNRADTTTYDLDGHMSDIMFWNDYCISPMEVDAIYNDGQYSVDPTIDKGDYTGASKLKLWLKCDATYTITAASSSTVYQAGEEPPSTPAGGSVSEIEEGDPEWDLCPEEAKESEEINCYQVVDPAGTPAVTGVQDFSGNNHHAKYVNNATIATDPPTKVSVSREYDF